MATDFDKRCMKLALDLAEKGIGFVAPNPLVGCVIVKAGKIAGKGFHEKFGKIHAEINALKQSGKKARNATMFVSLEPCCHYGKTPPCTKAIIEAGIKKVFISMKDPNHLVSGKGIAELKNSGIKVEAGLLKNEAGKLNEDYVFFMKHKMPFVVLKVAMTSNGMISWGNGRRKRISCRHSMKTAYNLRGKYSAVLAGIGTILKDNPELTAHSKKLHEPLRVVVDSSLKIPLNARVIGSDGNCLIACSEKASMEKAAKLAEKKAMVLMLGGKNREISLRDLLKTLALMGISSVIVEGGRKILTAFIKEKLCQKALFFVSEKKVEKGLFVVDEKIVKKIVLKNCIAKKTGMDTLIEGYF